MDKYQFECNECGKKFKHGIGKNTSEVKCPGCGGYDTEPTSMLPIRTIKKPTTPMTLEYRCRQCGREMNVVDYSINPTCLACCQKNQQSWRL